MKLYELVDAGPPTVVSWSESGLSFLVSNTEIFCDEILPRHFRHNKLTSFQRQLNLYGFHRISKGIDAGRYRHPLFQRGRLDLLSSIKRETRGESRLQRDTMDPRGFSQPMDNAVTAASGAQSVHAKLSSISSNHISDHTPSEANIGDRWVGMHSNNRQQLNEQRPPQHSLEGKWNGGNGGNGRGTSAGLDLMMVLQRQGAGNAVNGAVNGSSFVSRFNGGAANHHPSDNQTSSDSSNEHSLSLSSLSTRSVSSGSEKGTDTSPRTATASQEQTNSDAENAALAILGMSRSEPVEHEQSDSSEHLPNAGAIREAPSPDGSKNGYRGLDTRSNFVSGTCDVVRDSHRRSDSNSSLTCATAQQSPTVVDQELFSGDFESQLRQSLERQASLEREVDGLKNQLIGMNQTMQVLAQTVMRHLGPCVDEAEEMVIKNENNGGEYDGCRRVKRRLSSVSSMPEDCNPNHYDPEHAEQQAWSDYTDSSA